MLKNLINFMCVSLRTHENVTSPEEKLIFANDLFM